MTHKLIPQPLLLKREGEKNNIYFRKCFPLSYQERGPGGEVVVKIHNL